MKPKKKLYKKAPLIVFTVFLCLFIYNAISIHLYASKYVEIKSDVAIVLGAGTSNGVISPIFKERVNHAKYLFEKGLVKNIIITGGFGEGQKQTDSEVAKQYLIAQGMPTNVILTEEKSRYTIENLTEAKAIMDSLKFQSALLISDPLHMKRAISLAKNQNITCQPSPTKTSMYRSFIPKVKSLIYETFYYTLGQLTDQH